MKKYVSYLRVSTQKQKKSGLGLEAQRAIIEHYAAIDKAEIIREFLEAESGKETENRPLLKAAIEFCNQHDYTLIVAKLDRLSRDVEHIFKVQKQLGERFKSCDLPSTDSLTLSIFAGLAQREREIISIRTKQALNAKKQQGVTLGKMENLTQEGRKKGASKMQEKAMLNERNKRATQLIMTWKAQGATLQEIADRLNANSFETVRGRDFKPATVWYLYRRGEVHNR